MLIDTHAHLMFDQFKGSVPGVLERAKSAGVDRIINIGCDLKSSEQSVEMAGGKDDNGVAGESGVELYATLGLHPYDALDATEKLMQEWEELVKGNEKIVAIGECGLDYVKAEVEKKDQEKGFRLQLELAQAVKLPVVVHNRDADEDCLKILKDYDVQVVFHCYGSDVKFARKLWYAGYMTSFTGIITYPSAADLVEVVKECPMESFMVETDCPYLSPQKYRGQRNEPSYVAEVAGKIAEIKNLPLKDIERMSTENAEHFFLRMI